MTTTDAGRTPAANPKGAKSMTDMPIVHVVPAEPGWRLLFEGEDDDAAPLVRDAIVAWRIETELQSDGTWESIAHGVTICGESTGNDNVFGYLRPDGGIEMPVLGRTFDSLAAFMEYNNPPPPLAFDDLLATVRAVPLRPQGIGP